MPSFISESRILPTLEPLCAATGTLLAPIKLFRSDRLILDLDEEGRRFDLRIVTINLDGSVNDHYAPSSNASGILKRIPECFQHPDKRAYHWLAACTDVTALVIHHAWKADMIIFASEEAKIMYDYLLHRFLISTRNSAMVANYKIEHTAPLMPPDWIEHPDNPLNDYQKVCVLSAISTDGFGAFMEQGTGKTAASIGVVSIESLRKFKKGKNAADMYRVLIICPRQVRSNWCSEFRRFATVPGKTTVLRGGQITRAKSLVAALRPETNTLFTAVVSSYESIEKTWDAISMIPWDRIILDEAHKIKNPQTSRFKTLRKLRDCAKRRMILTGTPIANSIMDLWSQLEFLGDGLSGFLTYENFRKFYGAWKRVGEQHGVEKLVAIKNVPLIQERLARLTFMITKKEAGLNLPEKLLDIVEVGMSKKQRDLYCQMRDQLAAEIESELARDADEPTARTLSAEHILTRLLRLSQITSGFVKFDDTYNLDTGVRIAEGACENIHDVDELSKIQMVKEMITDEDRSPKAKMIVWTCWRQDRLNVHAALTRAGVDHVVYEGNDRQRDDAVRRFNWDPACKVIIASSKMLGEGSNLLGYDWDNETGPVLDTYCDTEVFYSENWSVLERLQAESRAHRKGTRTSIRIATLVATGTIDEEIYERLLSKVETAGLIQDIRAILQRILSLNPMLSDD